MPKREIKTYDTLGKILRKRREELDLSIEEVAHKIQAPPNYIQALEEDNYDIFTARVYTQGFFKKLMKAIGLENQDKYLQIFDAVWNEYVPPQNRIKTSAVTRKAEKQYFTPRRLGIAFVSIFLVGFLIFLGYRLTHFVGAPQIVFEEPQKDSIILTETTLHIKGKTEKESQLTVNGREITIDELGNFDDRIDLINGLNILDFLVHNKFGKQTVATKYVVVQK